MKIAYLALMGALAILPSASTSSPKLVHDRMNMPDERSDLIARMKKTVAYQDTAKEDPTDVRDDITSIREEAIFLRDIGIKDEYPHQGGTVSIGPEKNGSDIVVFVGVEGYVTPRVISLPDAKKYLAKREKR